MQARQLSTSGKTSKSRACVLTFTIVILSGCLLFALLSLGITSVFLKNAYRRPTADLHEHLFNIPGTLNNTVKRAFVIHLARRKDREENIQVLRHSLSELVSLEVIDAESGDSSTDCENGTSLRNGELGCAKSHIKILNKIAEEDTSANAWYFIFEDDAVPQKGVGKENMPSIIRTSLLEAIDSLPITTPMLFLGFNENLYTQIPHRVGMFTYLRRASSSTAAYAVRGSYARHLALIIGERLCKDAVDIIYSKNISNAGFVYSDKYRRHVSRERNENGTGLFGTKESFSDIQKRNPLYNFVNKYVNFLEGRFVHVVDK